MGDGLDVHRRSKVLHSGGGVDVIVDLVKYQSPAAMSSFYLLQNLQKSVQPCPDVHGVDWGPLGDVVGVDYTLQIEEEENNVQYPGLMGFWPNRTQL
jgi:hypothetical protein